jgi:hypothetical protein
VWHIIGRFLFPDRKEKGSGVVLIWVLEVKVISGRAGLCGVKMGKKRRREGGIVMVMRCNAMKLLFCCLRVRHSLWFGGEVSFVEWGDLGTV